MNVSCPDCHSVFRVDPARVPGPGVRARCSVCGGIIAITIAKSWTDDFAPGATPAGGSSAVRSTRSSGSSPSIPRATPIGAVPMPPSPDFSRGMTPPTVAPATSAPTTSSPTPTRVPPFMPQRRSTPAVTPAVGSRAMGNAQAMPRRTPEVSATPTVKSSVARSDTGVMTPATPVSPLPAHSGSTPAAGVRAPFATPPLGSAIAGGTRPPINPFLANDPNQKAKRLARALVSDMVAYHPQKREEGMRAGTLKQLFREEIKKSYEEYVEQIGKDFAEATSHFQDALNDVLAGGKKIF